MAAIRRRGKTWQVQIRRQGYPTYSKSFRYKADAEEWARALEAEVDRGDLGPSRRLLAAIRLSELLERYELEVSSLKKGSVQEHYKLRNLNRHSIANVSLDRLKPHHIAGYRDDRLQQVQSGTVRRELAVLQHCLEVARIDWGIPIMGNPVSEIRLPAPSKARERRLREGELKLLLNESAKLSVSYLGSIIEFAVETGMRRGEILALQWGHVDFTRKTVRVVESKNGCARTIPLSDRAHEILSDVKPETDLIFPVSANALRLSWQRLKRRVQINDLRFHDLRHEAVSRWFDQCHPVHKIASWSGHKDLRMLFRYAHVVESR